MRQYRALSVSLPLSLFGTLCLCLFLIAGEVRAQSDRYDSISTGGRWRTFFTHLPSGYVANRKYPLVLAFHGGGPLGYQSIQYQSQLTAKSDSAGFIIVYPEGVRIAGNRTFNAGGCCAPSTTLNIDDVGFTGVLLDTLFRRFGVDTTRVYATGFSNGSLLCYRLASQLSGRFAAIAPVAGDLVYAPWAPLRPVPIISFHSYADQNIKVQGGVTIGTTGTYFPPQDSIMGVIASSYSCLKRKDTVRIDPLTYDHFVYADCRCGAVLEQYVTHDGEHSWPGGLASGNVSASKQISATFLMWEFFRKYTTACEQTSVPHDEDDLDVGSVRLSPNPFRDRIHVTDCPDGVSGVLADESGRIVAHFADISDIDVRDLSFLPRGRYFLRLRGASSDRSAERTLLVVKD